MATNQRNHPGVVKRIAQALNYISGGKIKESLIDPGIVPYDDDPKAAQYRRLSSTTRDLLPIRYTTAQQMSFYLWQRNPLARRLIQILVDFCTGDEFAVKVKIKKTDADGNATDTGRTEAQAIWDKFWKDPVNKLDDEFPTIVQDLFINGELILPATVNLRPVDGGQIGDGRVRIGYVDPVNVFEVFTDPKNIREPVMIIARPPGGSGADDIKFKVARIDTDPNSPTFEHWTGDTFYFRMNKVINQKRGHPYLLDLADWLDVMDQFFFDAIEGFKLRNSFFYDLTLNGLSEEEIKERIKDITVPAPGSVRAHNEGATYDVVTPDLKSVDVDQAMQTFGTFVVGSKGYPWHWFGSGENTNRATAAEMGIPTMKMLHSVQNFIRLLVKTFCVFAMDMAVQAKELKLAPDETIDVEVTMYDFEKRDSADLATAFTQMTQGLTLAVTKGWVSQETAKKVMDGFITRLGVEVDPDETIEENLAELSEQEAADTAGLYNQGQQPPPGSGDQPPTPGKGPKAKKGKTQLLQTA